MVSDRHCYLVTDVIGGLDVTGDNKCDLLTLAREVERLAPSHRDPEAFHEAKSEIAYRLRMLAQGDTPSKDGKLKLSGPVRSTQIQLVPFLGRTRHGA